MVFGIDRPQRDGRSAFKSRPAFSREMDANFGNRYLARRLSHILTPFREPFFLSTHCISQQLSGPNPGVMDVWRAI